MTPENTLCLPRTSLEKSQPPSICWRKVPHFECRLTPIGDPTMVVEWLHDGKPLAAANRLRMVNEFGYCSLDYEVAYARDSGVITCRASNKFGVDQTSATLIVKDEKGLVEESQLPEGRKGAHRIDEIERMAHEGGPYGVTAEEETEKLKPEIVLLPEPVSVMEGDIARFRCRVTGYPAPKVNWYLNGQLIRKNEYSLVINKVQREFEGEYSCTVSNRYGQSTCTSYLHVELKEPEREERDDETFEPTGKPPEFTKTIESVQLSEGGQAFFRYIVTGDPLPEVQWLKGSFHIQPSGFKWYKDGQSIKEGDKYRIISRFRTSSLELLAPTKEDSGEYTCKASNQHGSDECSASLSVTGKSDLIFFPTRCHCLFSAGLLLIVTSAGDVLLA
uniref:Ig-like domain-containing protein n=1 Tax=Seriola lalandi dorsalis TaxID=1841481 RepID=A0A3B4X0T2_SERLL